eukprot:COSAG06_NODE_2241_length_7269_cov_9.419944_2_plen_449_part_00
MAIDDQRFTGKLADFGMTYEEPSASTSTSEATTDADAATNGSHGSASKPQPRSADDDDAVVPYGTWEYISPECLKPKYRRYHKPGPQSDVFSFGIMLWEMVARARPYTAFPGFEDDDDAPRTYDDDGKLVVDVKIIAQRLADGQRPATSASCPEVLHLLMQTCWVHDVDERPIALEVLTIIKKIREKEKEGILAPPSTDAGVEEEISYLEFLGQLGLVDKKDDLADYLSDPNAELTELQQMDEEALDEDIINDDDLGLTDEQKAQFRAAVKALPYMLPRDPYDEFLEQLDLQGRKADLAAYLSKPGNELVELTQMSEEDLGGDILEDGDLGFDEDTKARFRSAVVELREDKGADAEPVAPCSPRTALEIAVGLRVEVQTVESMQQLLDAKDQQMAANVTEMAKKDAEMAEKDAEIAEKDQQMAENHRRIAELEARLKLVAPDGSAEKP